MKARDAWAFATFLITASLLSVGAQAAQKDFQRLTVGYTPISGAAIPFFIAVEEKIFQKYGFEVAPAAVVHAPQATAQRRRPKVLTLTRGSAPIPPRSDICEPDDYGHHPVSSVVRAQVCFRRAPWGKPQKLRSKLRSNVDSLGSRYQPEPRFGFIWCIFGSRRGDSNS